MIDASHDVLVVLVTPGGDDFAKARCAVSGASPWHGQQQSKAGTGHGLHRIRIYLPRAMHELGENTVGKAANRTTMTVDQQGELTSGLVSGWCDEQTPDFFSIERFPGNGFLLPQLKLAKFGIHV